MPQTPKNPVDPNLEHRTLNVEPGSHGEPGSSDEINLLDLLAVLVKRKRLIFCVTVAAAILSVVYSLTLTNIYKATARIIPPGKDSGGGMAALLASQGGALAGMAGVAGIGGPADIYLSILKSRSMADAVIKRLNMADDFKGSTPDDIRSMLSGKVKFQAGKSDGIITIDGFDNKPERAAQLVNVFVDELNRATMRLNLTKASAERTFLEKRIEVVKQDLGRAEDELKVFSQKNKMVQVDAQARASIDTVARLKAELALKEVELATLRSVQTDNSPKVKSVLATIGRLRQEIGSSSGDAGMGGAIPSVGNVPSLGVLYTRLLRQVTVQAAIYEQLTRQFELAKLTEAKDSANIQVLDEAVAPNRKFKPKRSTIVILATVSAFFVSIFAAFVLEYYDKLPPEDRQRLNEMRESFRLKRGASK